MRPGRVIRDRLRRQVVVTLKSGAAFSGVLYEWDRDALVLRDARQLSTTLRDAPVPVDGELLVLRVEVDYLQLP